MAVSAPPKKKIAADAPAQGMKPNKVSEKAIDAIINRGGSPTAKPDVEPETVKQFNIKLMSGTLETINELRTKRPRKPISPKLAVSLNDWILEAIDAKIEQEKKKFGL